MIKSFAARELVDRVRGGDVADLDGRADKILTGLDRGLATYSARYNMACVLSLGSRYGPSTVREARAARAVRLLTDLLDGPFYRGSNNAAHVDADPDLDAIRVRADFHAFRVKLGPSIAPPPRPLR